MQTLIRHATLVTATSCAPGDLLCDDATGRILAVGEPEAVAAAASSDARIVDATGLHLLPGGVDPHVHAYLPLALTDAKTDYAQCTRAALLGGTTTICDFAGSGAEADIDAAYARWEETVADTGAFCDYAWHATVTRFDLETRRQLEARLAAGHLRSLKVYLAYKPALAISDPDLLALLDFAAANHLVTIAHCEHPDVIPYLQNRLFASGCTGPDAHEPSRPPFVEAEGVTRFLTLAAATGAPAYIAHISSAAALAAYARFHDDPSLAARFPLLAAETMPHYLLLDDACTHLPDFQGAKFILSPPLRTPADQDALWQALRDGPLTCLSTDHCPFDFDGQKTLGRDDFRRIPNGIQGVQERLPLILHHGPRHGLTLSRIVDLAATTPARIFGLSAKGRLAPGGDADFALWDLRHTQTLTQATQSIPTDYTPYEGFTAAAPPVAVYLRGRPVVQSGALLPDIPPLGQLL